MQVDIEWEDAPGVRDRVLAATWGRLAIRVGTACVTELLDLRSSSRRTAVYGSAFPLAEWVVEHWWHLLHEPCPTSPVVSAREARAWMRPTLQRHGILSARDGGALPDLSIWSDGPECILRWDADPPTSRGARVRFVSQGQAHLPTSDVQAGLTALVNQVIGRLEALGLHDDEDARRLQAAWSAVASSMAEEPVVCRRLALLGLDPYDPDEATDEVIALMERGASLMPAVLVDDLLEATRPAQLYTDLAWVAAGARAVHAGRQARLSAGGGTAHEAGYAAARATRDLLGLDQRCPVSDLRAALVDGLGWSEEIERTHPAEVDLEAVVGWSAQKPLAIVPSTRREAGSRFRLARAAYLILTGAAAESPRLLSSAATRTQRASRAFAAELLLPAAALGERLGGSISDSAIEEVADEYRVSPLLVRHQIENHGIGSMEA
ncbi:MAG: hypothetical protein R3F60_33380 [bacterium]